MSTTQIPPANPAPPEQPSNRPLAGDLYDAQHWELAYTGRYGAPALLVQLQDDLTRSRKREAFWISVVVHLIFVLVIVNSQRIGGWLPHRAVMIMNPNDKDKNLTYLELPTDEQKITKRPDTKIISDKDRVATSRAPQVNREELKKILDSARAGRPGPTAPPAQQPAPAPQQAQPSQQPQAPPPPEAQNQEPRNCKLRRRTRPGRVSIPVRYPPARRSTRLRVPWLPIEEGMVETAERTVYLWDARQPPPRGRSRLRRHHGRGFRPLFAARGTRRQSELVHPDPESARAPLMKKGKVSIEFAILKDGKVAGMRYVSDSGDVALDRAAYGGITASNPFPPLPSNSVANIWVCASLFTTIPTRTTFPRDPSPKGLLLEGKTPWLR